MKNYLVVSILLIYLGILNTSAQNKKPHFSWINPLTKEELNAAPGLTHHSFKSKLIGKEVGYCVFLPPGYGDPKNRERQYAVIYMLHGGRPGDESKFANKLPFIYRAIQQGQLMPTIVVLNNGGPVSHYNVPGQKEVLGKDLLIEELLPLIDREYRTVAAREGRGLQGYSQGGRAVARIGLGHPELFSHLVIGSAGAGTERRIYFNDGKENENLVFAAGDDMWTHAENYAKKFTEKYPMEIFLHVGDFNDTNYDGNLAYDAFLAELNLDHTFLIVPDQKHGGSAYEKIHDKIISFQNHSFENSLQRLHP